MERKTFQGTRVNAYRSKNGNPTFVYRINNATEAELATYKAFKGATYRSEIQEVNGQIVIQSQLTLLLCPRRLRLVGLFS